MVGFPTDGGLVPYNVTGQTAVGISTVWRCLDVIGNGVAQLDWYEHRGTLDLPLSRLTRRPSAFYTRREWTQMVVRTLALYDVAYLLKLEPYDAEGVPMGLWPVPPQIIVPRTLDTYTYVPPTSYVVGRTVVEAENIVVIRRAPLPGIPDYLSGLLRLARAEFAKAIAASNYQSRYWQSGGTPTTVLETDANLSDAQATQLGNRWSQRRAKGPDHPAILSHGLKGRPWGADATSASGVTAVQDIEAGIARAFGIPPRMANVLTMSNEVYKTAQEENLDLLHYTLSNYIGAIEDAITDILPGNREMSMQTAPLTEGTQLARAQAWQAALGTPGGGPGWISVPEVREKEGLPPQEMPEISDESQKPSFPVPFGPTAAEVSDITGSPPR